MAGASVTRVDFYIRQEQDSRFTAVGISIQHPHITTRGNPPRTRTVYIESASTSQLQQRVGQVVSNSIDYALDPSMLSEVNRRAILRYTHQDHPNKTSILSFDFSEMPSGQASFTIRLNNDGVTMTEVQSEDHTTILE